MSISPLDPITALPGVGAARAAELADAGVARVVDLLLHLPMRYEDRTRIAPIANLIPEGPAITVKGKVLSARLIRTRRPGFTIFESLIDDGTAPLKLVFFNQPHLARWITPEKDLFAFGVASFGRGRVLQMENPQLELDEPDPLTTGRIVPIYRKLPGLAPRLRRKLVARVLDEVADHLPERLGDLPERLGLPPLGVSLREAHFPSVPDPVSFENRTSRHLLRLVFEEFLEFQLRLQTRRQARMARTAPRLVANEAIRKRLREFLPFALTNAQKRVIREIRDDFSSGKPMRRLLQGDVGSGKTIVALLSAFLAKELGYQSALMVPTEILAEQHASTIARLLAKDPLSLHPALLTGRIKGRARNALLGALEAGEVDLLVGTHALFQDPVAFHRLGLVIIDEQHRFGVAQRAALSAKTTSSAEIPHVLVMSATPIPRSLALTLYGDLDVSTIDERPPGRTPIVTRVLPEEQRARIFREIDDEIAAGGQAYVVVPLVEESDKIEAKAVEKHADVIRKALPGRRIGVLHGRLSSEEREATMRAFVLGELDVVAATTVIEVGVDVPNASYMAIENAERFGLAQIHQLRGRVGRGRRASRCVLLYGDKASMEARARLGVLAKTEDGFEVAEEDLRRRGPGDALGTRQSGVPMFKVGDLVRDQKWMATARDEAVRLLAAGERALLEAPLFFRENLAEAD